MKMEPSENEKRSHHFFRSVWNFICRFPILFNIVLIIGAACLVFWLLLGYVDRLTLHGIEDTIPDVKGLTLDEAARVLEAQGMGLEVADSIFDSANAPGTVIEQNPHANSKVKPGRTVYVSIVAFSPKQMKFPDVLNASLKQAESYLESSGFKNYEIKYVKSEYKDLVLGVMINGKPLQPGNKVAVNAHVILEVGDGGDISADEEEIEEFYGYETFDNNGTSHTGNNAGTNSPATFYPEFLDGE